MSERPTPHPKAPPEADDEGRLPRPGEVVADRYQIDGYLGRGGMGAVLSAVHLVTRKRCAIKWVLPRGDDRRAVAKERLLREARMAGRIDHPNVVRVIDVGEHRGSIFLVMELLRGEPLKATIARGPLAVDDAIRLLMPVMRGVAAAHEVGIVHRDLKPDNILLARTDDALGAVRPTVLDFGISRGAEDGVPGDLTLTQTGMMIGTPLYMAPEQLAGASEVDPRYDVYALGVILYELVTGGAYPFEGETYALLVSSKLNDAPVPPSERRSDLDPRFEKCLLKSIARRPGARWPSVQAFATALEPFGEGCAFHDTDPYWRPAGPAQDVTLRTARTPRRRVPWVAALAGVVGLAAAAGVWRSTRAPAPVHAAVEPAAPVAAASIEPAPAAAAATDAGVALAPAEVPEPGSARRPARSRGRTGRLRVDEF